MLVDPDCRVLKEACPFALVDAILAKKNLGTSREMAPKTIALGPGCQAGRDADLVIETMRGHQLGRVIHEGSALPDTGVPGLIQGYGAERVIHAPAAGRMENLRKIGDIVKKGEPIARILGAAGEVTEVPASLDGLLRGLIRDGYPVTEGFKIADIDPRQEEYDNCFTHSDKARCIAGGVLEGDFISGGAGGKEMIYLDSAATSFYRPPEVAEAVVRAMESMGNSGRGVHGASLRTARTIYRARCLLAELFHGGRSGTDSLYGQFYGKSESGGQGTAESGR